MFGLGRPKIPEGGRAFVSQEDVFGTRWTVRVAMPGEDETPRCAHLKGAPFVKLLTTAEAYRAYAAREVDSFSYPPGEA